MFVPNHLGALLVLERGIGGGSGGGGRVRRTPPRMTSPLSSSSPHEFLFPFSFFLRGLVPFRETPYLRPPLLGGSARAAATAAAAAHEEKCDPDVQSLAAPSFPCVTMVNANARGSFVRARARGVYKDVHEGVHDYVRQGRSQGRGTGRAWGRGGRGGHRDLQVAVWHGNRHKDV